MSTQSVRSYNELQSHLSRFSDVCEQQSIHRDEYDTHYYIVVNGTPTLLACWDPAYTEDPIRLYEPGRIIDKGKGWQKAD